MSTSRRLCRGRALLGSAAALVAAALPPFATAQAPTPIPIRVATPGNDGNALAFYAQALGLFRRYGLQAQIQVLRAGGGEMIIAGIAGGSLDVGESDLVAIAAAREHGVPITMLAPSYMFRTGDLTSVIITARDSNVHTAKDLDGQTVGVASLGGVGRMLTTKWLEDNGADLSTIKFVEIPQVSMQAALVRGTIAAAQSGEPNTTAAGDAIRILASTYAAVGNEVQSTAWCSSEQWTRSNPEAAKRFVSAIHAAAVWADDPRNHPKSAAILQQWLPFPAGLAERMHRAYYGQAFEVAALQPLIDAAFRYKALASRIDARELISPYALLR